MHQDGLQDFAKFVWRLVYLESKLAEGVPAPGGLDNSREIAEFGLPAKDFAGEGGVGDKFGGVAGATVQKDRR